MDLNQAIRNIVREEIAEIGGIAASEPVLISVEQTASICDCDKTVILALHHEREKNGFPSIQLGPRTIKIDERRLNAWFASGGLGVNA